MQPEYRVLNWLGPAGGGINPSEWVALQALAKCDNESSPYLVANELIAAEIGHYLRLPVAPSCVATKDGTTYFMCLSFNLTGQPLPRVFPEEIAELFPDEAAGIVAFDTLLANYDRHWGNIAAVTTNEPRRIDLFDHDRCLLGHLANGGVEHLREAESQLGIVGMGNDHCLVGHVADACRFHVWFDRIENIPDFFIIETCRDAQRYGGLTEDERWAVQEFLLKRRHAVRHLLMRAQAQGRLGVRQDQLVMMI